MLVLDFQDAVVRHCNQTFRYVDVKLINTRCTAINN